MRKPLVAGNWKMFTVPSVSKELAAGLKSKLAGCGWADLVVCPPYTSLTTVISELTGTSIDVGAQNLHWESEGAFTGEISPQMLSDSGCKWVIIGHSERRAIFGETDDGVFKKINAALKTGLKPIVCVGESLEQRDSGVTEEIVKGQLLGGIGQLNISGLTIAYEPVWAIGTGRTATPQQAQDVHRFLRNTIKEKWGQEKAESIKILYGGSVKPENAGDLSKKDDIDGFLVGGASLKADSFAAIIETLK
ncbi:MAG: triose-phosphate isomerase [candidate division Zixibacteria bacterium]